MEINTITAIGAAGTAIAAALPKEISIKMYDDLAHPSAKELGELVAILPRTGKEIINSFVGLVQEYGKKNTALLAQSVEAKMKSIPEGKLVRPSTNTIIPAVQANAYNESEKLREMYANLVAKSMNADFHDKVHPAYVEIIKQLSPAEAVFLEEPGLLLQVTPICTVKYQEASTFQNIMKWNLHPNNIIRDARNGFVSVHYYNPHLFQKYGEYQRMIDNFIRLHLMEAPEGNVLSDKDSYADFYLDDVMQQIQVIPRKGYELAHVPGVLVPTTLGKDFFHTCIEDE